MAKKKRAKKSAVLRAAEAVIDAVTATASVTAAAAKDYVIGPIKRALRLAPKKKTAAERRAAKKARAAGPPKRTPAPKIVGTTAAQGGQAGAMSAGVAKILPKPGAKSPTDARP
jgi:hypothetical protein